MKASPNKTIRLKLLFLFLFLGLNMSWFHNLFDDNQQMAEFASSETASSLSVDPSTRTVSYQRSYTGHKYVWKTSIQQIKKEKTDFWGNPEPGGGEEIAYKASARMEGCYGHIDCRDSHLRIIRASDLNMTEDYFNNKKNVAEVIARIQELFDPILDAATEAKIKKEKEKEKELARQEKLEKEIENCLRDEDGKKISGHKKLACKAERLGDYEDEELELAFAEIRDETRALLASGNPSDRKRGRNLLSIMGGGHSKEINNTLRAMRLGADYTHQYTEHLRAYLTTSNPQQKQLNYNQLIMLKHRYNMNSYTIAPSSAASSELSYWQQLQDQQTSLLLDNPHASWPGTEPTITSPSLPSVFNHLAGRTLRQVTPMARPYNRQSPVVTAPQNYNNYLTTNPLVNRPGNGSSIPQVGELVIQ